MTSSPSHSATSDTSSVGVVGLGLVGQALAQRLQQAGWRCMGWDIDSHARERFAQAGHVVADSMASMASQVDVMVLAVYDTAGVREVARHVVEAPARSARLTLIDCSTGHPEQLLDLHRWLDSHGIGLIEAPLSGSSAQIAAGQATLLLGGDIDLIRQHHALLQALSPRQHHLGGIGMGCAAKLASNLVLGLNRVALAEGLVFAQRLGLDAQAFLDLLQDSPARSEAVVSKGPQMVARDFEPRSRIRQHLKDLDIMLDMAARQGQALPMTQTHRHLLQQAVAAGDGELDNAAVIREIERQAKPPLPPSIDLPPSPAGD
jgi:3-hydroxyisobutyrate dehydrogenase-like beta-hydroxyacid dehydrogenase